MMSAAFQQAMQSGNVAEMGILMGEEMQRSHKLKKEKNELASQFSALQDEHFGVEVQLARKTSELESLQQDFSILATDIKIARSLGTLNEGVATLNQLLNQQVSKLKQQNSVLEVDKSKLFETNCEFQLQLVAIQKELKQQKAQFETQSAELEKQKELVYQLTIQIDAKSKENVDALAQMTSLEEVLMTKKSESQRLNEECSKLKASSQSFVDQLSSLKNDMEKQKAQVEELIGQLEDQKDKNSKLTLRNNILNEANQDAQKQLTSLKEVLKTQNSELEADKLACQKKLSESAQNMAKMATRHNEHCIKMLMEKEEALKTHTKAVWSEVIRLLANEKTLEEVEKDLAAELKKVQDGTEKKTEKRKAEQEIMNGKSRKIEN